MGSHSASDADNRFFVYVAATLFLLTIIAFSTTYILPVAKGRFTGEAILHVHGAMFLAWPVLFLTQTLSIQRSKRWHRGLGFLGIALASGMVLSGLLAVGSSIRTWSERGVGAQGQFISIVAFSGLMLFAALFIAAISNTRRRAFHARYLVFATLAIMQGVSGRLALLAVLKGNPEMFRPGMLTPPDSILPVTVVHLLFDMLFIALMAWHDRRSLGRIHRATLIGAIGLLTVHSTRFAFADTAQWAGLAGWLASL